MKRLFLVSLLLGLCGCSSLFREDGDWFEADGRSPQQFEDDNYACSVEAERQVGSNWSKAYDTSYDQIHAYNRVYTGCMAARHYRPRAYFENWLPG